MLRFGIYFEPCQFVMAAARKQHPFLINSGLPSVTLHGMRTYLGLAPHEVVSMRADQLRAWSDLKSKSAVASELKVVDPSLIGILGAKDFAFWEAALVEVGYKEAAWKRK
eukprot:1438202-Amphidinium_carterae.1